jgi:hypothetical protein
VIAALYVEKDGAYYGLPDVDPWDEERDARLYDGPWPVVAHPPCNRWVSYGARRLRGQDGGCFAAALEAVRTFGGVLEHPARSQAWRAFDLPRPTGPDWTRTLTDPGWVCEVDQWLYGYPTRKVTWLYFVGDAPGQISGATPTPLRGCESLWSTERIKTPPEFRNELLAMVRPIQPASQQRGGRCRIWADAGWIREKT